MYPTFRAACYALGLLDDDQEYIDGIQEASRWATGNFLTIVFVSMLLSHCLSQPLVVWDNTKFFLSEDMLYIPRADTLLSGIVFTISPFYIYVYISICECLNIILNFNKFTTKLTCFFSFYLLLVLTISIDNYPQ